MNGLLVRVGFGAARARERSVIVVLQDQDATLHLTAVQARTLACELTQAADQVDRKAS